MRLVTLLALLIFPWAAGPDDNLPWYGHGSRRTLTLTPPPRECSASSSRKPECASLKVLVNPEREDISSIVLGERCPVRRQECRAMWPANTPALWSLISLVSDVSSSVARTLDRLSVSLKPGAKAAPYCLRKVPTSVLPCFRLISPFLSRWRLSRPGSFIGFLLQQFSQLITFRASGKRVALSASANTTPGLIVARRHRKHVSRGPQEVACD
jgi:hypothetical protein